MGLSELEAYAREHCNQTAFSNISNGLIDKVQAKVLNVLGLDQAKAFRNVLFEGRRHELDLLVLGGEVGYAIQAKFSPNNRNMRRSAITNMGRELKQFWDYVQQAFDVELRCVKAYGLLGKKGLELRKYLPDGASNWTAPPGIEDKSSELY